MKKYLMLWVLTLSLLTPSVWALTPGRSAHAGPGWGNAEWLSGGLKE